MLFPARMFARTPLSLRHFTLPQPLKTLSRSAESYTSESNVPGLATHPSVRPSIQRLAFFCLDL